MSTGGRVQERQAVKVQQCCGRPGSGNGGHSLDCPNRPDRIFDHLTGDEPWCAKFSRIARAMRRGVLRPATFDAWSNQRVPCDEGPTTWWQTVPERDDLDVISGEICNP